MKYRLRFVWDNIAIAFLAAALATTEKPGWLWWPVNTNWFLWFSVALAITSGFVSLLLYFIEGDLKPPPLAAEDS